MPTEDRTPAGSPLKDLPRFGQSPWLDFIGRRMLRSGELGRMIESWGIRGVTSNPTIFEKAIAHSPDYDEQIGRLVAAGHRAEEIYEALVLEDIRAAADILRDVYEQTSGLDGHVSLEVSPHLVRDTAATVAEAKRLWRLLDRPNVMIKVPGTPEGLPAIRQLIGDGVNVNVTLLFSLDRYREVAETYLAGLEDAGNSGRSLDTIASVASFFLSRIDTMVDPMLDEVVDAGGPEADTGQRLKGQTATASARCAYGIFQDVLSSDRFRTLSKHGARPQRLLWASTGTKNPAYSDVKYVDPLVGPDTVNTMPLETLRAYDDHGNPGLRLTPDTGEAGEILSALGDIGIELDAITDRLLEDGIRKFNAPFDATHRALRRWSA